MGEFEQEVKRLALERFGSLAELARVTNLNYQTVRSMFTSGSFRTSRSQTVTPIANALELDPNGLMRERIIERSARFRGFVEVPLYSRLDSSDARESINTGAGYPGDTHLADERFPIHKELADRYPGAFLLRVSGESMNRILPDGCYALVTPCSTVERAGQPYVVAIGDTPAIVRRVRMLGNGIQLTPDCHNDTTWPVLTIDYAKDGDPKVTILGRVVSYYLPLNWSFLQG